MLHPSGVLELPPRYAAKGVLAVGVTRKLLSTCSAGLVDFRSDKERVARSARKTLHATRRQNRLLRQQPPAIGAAPAVAAPQGHWLPDPAGVPGLLRWWDGYQWTSSTAVVQPPR